MSSKSSGDWRDKYLDALDEQERLQQQFIQQQELLRRALVRVSLAAEGHDEQLDRELQKLRHAVKSDNGELESTMESVEESLLQYDRRRETTATAEQESLLSLSEALREQTEDRQLQKNLKGFIKACKKGEAGTTTEQLKQYKWLQQQFIEGLVGDSADQKRPGLLSRILGRSEDVTEASEGSQQTEEFAPAPKDECEEASPESVDKDDALAQTATRTDSASSDPVAEAESNGVVADSDAETLDLDTPAVLEGQLQTKAEAQVFDEHEAHLQRPVHEPAFSRISDKVKHILNDLLDNVEPSDCTEQKAVQARERIESGLNWYELVPTLEDIRDLVLQAYLLADEEYREYLEQLNQVLEGVLSGLGATVNTQQDWLSADEQFDQLLTHQLGSLGRSVAVATEVNGLKQEINLHLQAIEDALQEKQQHPARSQLGDQLAELVAQVKKVEQEAASAKAQLEEQKQKAVTDTLTGLPNREAYNDRGFHEWSRWQRYGHPLTMVVCDIDHFKRINDNYGHQAGDRVLQVLSRAVSQRLREVDFMARYGGEEFVILLPETDQQSGFQLVDKIRAVIADTPFRFKQEPVQVTLSMGVVGLKTGDTLESAFARADELLYQAKDAGRNCCLQDSRA
ncbi:MAG: hypothetical protein CL693_01440 [Cellvibrionaceae bacterium]|nr:hypothetical protein [Cellvibrionaceae bacterium]|tara:strand:+ start:103 stop:1983 length:1881 start_codon:yes stop_codon:yes gene_type:complete